MGWSELNLEAEFPGDYSSDAQFYAFIGIIITWLYCSATKSYPMYDLVIALVLAFIWLCAASAWAYAVLGLRSIANFEVQLKVRWKRSVSGMKRYFCVLSLLFSKYLVSAILIFNIIHTILFFLAEYIRLEVAP